MTELRACTRKVIITGDDFGLALPVNEAIEHAYRHGALTTTSLLIGEQAAADAIARARRNPGLRVGLHLAVCEASPVLPAQDVRVLVNTKGQLRHPLVALVYLLMPWTWRALEAEIRAQFAAFAATGLPLDHVNGHNHMQLHPAVLPILLRVAREYGSPPIRLAYEPLIASTRAAGFGRLLARFPWLVMRPWNVYIKHRLSRAGFRSNDYLFGIYDCGQIDLELLLGFIRNLPEGVSEIHCHLANARCAEIDRSMPFYRHEAELAALISPRVFAMLEAEHVSPLAGFRDLS